MIKPGDLLIVALAGDARCPLWPEEGFSGAGSKRLNNGEPLIFLAECEPYSSNTEEYKVLTSKGVGWVSIHHVKRCDDGNDP